MSAPYSALSALGGDFIGTEAFMRGKTGDDWYPFWIDKWLFGSTKFEFTPAERSVWVDLLTLAHKDNGFIRANENMPYPPEHLANLFVVPLDLLQSTIKKSVENGKLQKLEDGSMFVVSYEKYELSKRHRRRMGEEFEPKYERFLPCPIKFIDMATKKGYVRKSRLLVAITLKRILSKKEEVHHINNIENDDNIENLMLFGSHKEHLQYQNGYEIKPIWNGKNMSIAAIKAIMAEFAALYSAATKDTKSRVEESRVEKEERRIYTIEQVKDACILNEIPENNAKSYFDQYNSQDWKKANDQPITNLRSHIAKRWNKSKQCWDFDEKKEQADGQAAKKTKLFPIPGKRCSERGCGMPAVYKWESNSGYDFYACSGHLPAKVKEKYE